MEHHITFEAANTVLRYDPETGKLFWKPRPPETFATERAAKIWNGRFAGAEAFTSDDGAGYRQGSINYRTYRAHKIAWLLHSGTWASVVDHINGDRSDNRAANLRGATSQQNATNQKRSRANTSGVVGVYWVKRDTRWASMIVVNGKTIGLGRYHSFESAVAARKEAEKKHSFHENHGR